MLIPLQTCIQSSSKMQNLIKNTSESGVVHIGAHLGEECEDYVRCGFKKIIWIEANKTLLKELFDKTNKICSPAKVKQSFFSAVVSDTDNEEVNFNITNNGQSSSILELGTHLQHHPHVQVSEVRKLKTIKFKTIVENNKLNLENYWFLNLDIQGAELKALKGFEDLLLNFSAIYTEVNDEEVYKGCCTTTQLDEYLKDFGFKRIKTKMTEFKWGDALYVKD